MKTLLPILTDHFSTAVSYLILFVEIIGVGVLIYAIGRALYELFRHKGAVRLELAEGIGLALEIKMVGELLRTVVARELEELIILGTVILLRAAIAFLVYWEIKNEKKTEQKPNSHPET